MKAENLRNPKISLHVPIAAPKLELWALNITGRIYLIAAVYLAYVMLLQMVLLSNLTGSFDVL